MERATKVEVNVGVLADVPLIFFCDCQGLYRERVQGGSGLPSSLELEILCDMAEAFSDVPRQTLQSLRPPLLLSLDSHVCVVLGKGKQVPEAMLQRVSAVFKQDRWQPGVVLQGGIVAQGRMQLSHAHGPPAKRPKPES